jgi:hypothetical protein
MPIYFMVLDSGLYHDEIHPALAASWARRSFEPCRRLSVVLEEAARKFAESYRTGPAEPLLLQVARGVPFDRHFWQLLVGEALLFAAKEIPEFPVCPQTLGALLAPALQSKELLPREEWAPIHQAHYGSGYVQFGGRVYRPEHAGLNNIDDISRLAAYLADVDPEGWSAEDLPSVVEDEEARLEELEDAKAWYPALRDLYIRARAGGAVLVCEEL